MATLSVAPSANGSGRMEDESENPRPDMDKVLDLKKEYMAYYEAFHDQCGVEEDYYYLRKKPKVPEGFDPVMPATARSIVNIATDHVDVKNIEIDVPLASPRAKARAEKLKKFYQGAHMALKGPVERTAVRHAFIYGIAWKKKMWASDQWPSSPRVEEYDSDSDYRQAMEDFLEKKSVSWPLLKKNVNPQNLIWDDSDIRPQWAIEFYDRSACDIRKKYPEWASAKNDGDMVDWFEYWDEEWVGYAADNQWVWGPHKHGYGFLPYTAIIPASALNWDSGKPEDRFQGILYPVHNLIDEEARLVTAYDSILRQYAWKSIDFRGNVPSATAAAEEYELFGKNNVIPPGVEVSASPNVAPPPELLRQLDNVQTMIEGATYPNVIRGARPKGVSAGYPISVLAGMGRLVFEGVAQATAQAIREDNRHFAMLIENKAKSRVTVHARSDVHNFDQSIGPEDIKGYYESTVKLKAEAPEEQERQALLSLQLYNAGSYSLYEHQKRIGISNPLEEQMQMGAEQILNSPEVQQAKNQLAAQRMGLFEQLAAAVGGEGEEAQGTPEMNAGQFTGGTRLPRPGEGNIQEARVASREGRPSVYAQSPEEMNVLGRNIGTPMGGGLNMPSGQRVR